MPVCLSEEVGISLLQLLLQLLILLLQKWECLLVA